MNYQLIIKLAVTLCAAFIAIATPAADQKPNIVFIMGDVTSPATTHYAKLHAMLTDHSPLHVSLFAERAAAAKWLDVPVEALEV